MSNDSHFSPRLCGVKESDMALQGFPFIAFKVTGRFKVTSLQQPQAIEMGARDIRVDRQSAGVSL